MLLANPCWRPSGRGPEEALRPAFVGRASRGGMIAGPRWPSGPMVMAPIDDLAEAFRMATLRSECTRILGLLLVLAAALAVVVTRALLTGVPEQLALVPQIVALMLAAAAYEVLMLAHVRRALRRGDDLPSWAWALNIGVEALIPSAAILLLTRSAFIGPYRALAAPAAHSYYFFIILSAFRLRPVLCFLTGVASALGFVALTAYTF